jgi:beta-N-acetylhexosaminidase
MKINKYILIAIIIIIFVSIFFLIIINNKNNKSEEVYQTENNEDLDRELKDKIGQMLIVGFRGVEINNNSSIVKAINELNLGGVILFDYDVPSKGKIQRNIINPKQLKNLTSDLSQLAPLFIAVDAEGGYVNRLKERYGFENIPSAQEMGQGTLEQTKQYGNLLGKQLRELGFNLNFAPVVDVNINPENPIIGYLERSFSGNPEKVAEYASNFIQGLNQNKIISAIKHFPGHGSSENDSHLGMVDITKTYKQEELLPYKTLISSGYSDMVMTAHVINSNIDPVYPATLSFLFLKNILRDELGFKGIIVSDDMQMEAIRENYGFEEAIIKSINAGCDILIISNNNLTYDEQDYYRAVEIIFNAVKNQEIKEERINESYQRILLLKERI